MTEALTPTEKSKKQRDNTKIATKNFDYTTIADRLRTVSWGNDSHPAQKQSWFFSKSEIYIISDRHIIIMLYLTNPS